ncbi:MAG TPA: RNA polymerase sigma factor [Ramlibacter sp.]|nr:RNA polymerase sigma factor [Ramlibacter sp.]
MPDTKPLSATFPLSDKTPDVELAALAAAGNARAFEAIMRRHNRLLFRTARSILKSDADAEDAVQDTYLSAWRALGSFREDAKLSTWLVRIVLNEALKRVRRRASNVVMFDTGAVIAEEQLEASMEADHDEQPELAASRAEMRRLMEARIDELPELFRTVFMLRAVEEMSVEEVSAALDIPETTVRTRFFRARAHLRDSLSRDMDFALEGAFSFDGARCDRIVAGVLAIITRDGNLPPHS